MCEALFRLLVQLRAWCIRLTLNYAIGLVELGAAIVAFLILCVPFNDPGELDNLRSLQTRFPAALVELLRTMPREELVRRQIAMARYAADIVYDAPESRVGTNILTAVMMCRNHSYRPPAAEHVTPAKTLCLAHSAASCK